METRTKTRRPAHGETRRRSEAPVAAAAESERGARPDLEGLARHVETLLRTRLDPKHTFHDPRHTLDEVVPAADRLARAEGIEGHRRLLIRAAALLHDTGYTETADGHEAVSARIAGEILPRFGFAGEEVAAVQRLILATRLGTRPDTVDEAIMADADLDLLGREDFWERSLDLRREMAATGTVYDERAWAERQIRFLEGHRYHTKSARALRQEGKAANLRRMQDHLGALDADEPRG